MKTGQGLAEYALAQLGRPYWWGCFGQLADAALYAQKKKQYPAYYTAADFPSQYGQKVHDCVGLIKGYLWCDSPDGPPKYNAAQDVAVEGLYKKCSKRGDIGSLPEKPGVCVFMANMGHVGVYIGGGEVVEAMGHAYGVVKTKLTGRGWAYWGMPGWIDYAGETPQSASQTAPLAGEPTTPQSAAVERTTARVAPTAPTRGAFTLSFRILKEGCVGEDVRALQLMLKARGYPCGNYGTNGDGADGDFGTATKAKLIAYQSAAGLGPDGEAGPQTMGALLGIH